MTGRLCISLIYDLPFGPSGALFSHGNVLHSAPFSPAVQASVNAFCSRLPAYCFARFRVGENTWIFPLCQYVGAGWGQADQVCQLLVPTVPLNGLEWDGGEGGVLFVRNMMFGTSEVE